jgi:hypothetical protein
VANNVKNPSVNPQVKESKPVFTAPVIIVLALIAIGVIGFWYLSRDPGPLQQAPLTQEAKSYVRNLKLSDVEMKATENAVHQTIVEIVGKIGNGGDRKLRSVELNCVFYDSYGQLALRERVDIVRARFGGLAPGETKGFRLAFDNLPQSWNQGMPQLVIAGIDFE